MSAMLGRGWLDSPFLSITLFRFYIARDIFYMRFVAFFAGFISYLRYEIGISVVVIKPEVGVKETSERTLWK